MEHPHPRPNLRIQHRLLVIGLECNAGGPQLRQRYRGLLKRIPVHRLPDVPVVIDQRDLNNRWEQGSVRFGVSVRIRHASGGEHQ